MTIYLGVDRLFSCTFWMWLAGYRVLEFSALLSFSYTQRIGWTGCIIGSGGRWCGGSFIRPGLWQPTGREREERFAPAHLRIGLGFDPNLFTVSECFDYVTIRA